MIGKLTAETDPVYDNSGSFVVRPHLHYNFFTDQAVQRTSGTGLAKEVPRLIEQKGCTAWLYDIRFRGLDPSLQDYLTTRFVPYNDDIYLWGRRYVAKGGESFRADFLAVRDAIYFVYPPPEAGGGALTIDGAPVDGTTFRLTKGRKTVGYRGKSGVFYILWMPRSGPYVPLLRKPHPRFSRLFRD